MLLYQADNNLLFMMALSDENWHDEVIIAQRRTKCKWNGGSGNTRFDGTYERFRRSSVSCLEVYQLKLFSLSAIC